MKNNNLDGIVRKHISPPVPAAPVKKPAAHSEPKPPHQEKPPKKSRQFPRIWIRPPNMPPVSSFIPRGKTIFIIATALFVWIAGSIVMARMKVTVSPKTAAVAIDRSVTVWKNSAKQGELSFGSIALPDKREGVFASKEKKSIQERARGTVMIFNKSSKSAQVLVASTRLEDPDGRIYRIPKSVIVPGYTMENGKVVPGSRETEVIADEAGSEYNIGLSDFTIPGFKGSSKFSTVFARSKTEMTGGAIGVRGVIAKKEVEDARAELHKQAKADAERMLQKKLPPDAFLIMPSVEYAVIREEVTPGPGEVGDSFTIRIEGEARAAMLNKKSFEKLLAGVLPAPDDTFSFSVKNLDRLSYELKGYAFGANSFHIQIKGEAQFEAFVDPEAVRLGISEKRISNAAALLGAFPEVARSEVRFRPFWLHRLPRNTHRIDVTLEPLPAEAQ